MLRTTLVTLAICGCAHATEPPVTVEKFEIEGRTVTLKVPERAAAGRPWLWVGEFAGHLRTLEDGLVASGWHVASVDMKNQFGSPAAMDVWEHVYEDLHHRRGLSAKPALLGISRGGLYVNAWLRRHPDRAGVLYLDNAVCDPRSWPGGFELNRKGRGSAGDWTRYKTVLGFDDESALAESIRPEEGLLPAIEAGVVLISCHGTTDDTVPYEDNAAVLIKLWQDHNGTVELFVKPGGGHHPHGLPDPQPLIDALVKHTPASRRALAEVIPCRESFPRMQPDVHP